MKIILLRFALFISLLAGSCLHLYAHDPGLSSAKLTVSNKTIVLSFSYSLKDINHLIDIDVNRDGHFSSSELDLVKNEISGLIENNVQLHAGNKLLPAQQNSIHFEPNDSLNAQLIFNHQTQSALNLSLSLIKDLPRGHRQYISINNEGKQFQKILNKNSASILLSKEQNTSTSVLKDYFIDGIIHIWQGLDHLIFLLTLLLPAVLIFKNHLWFGADNISAVFTDTVKIITAFTVAHSITLSLAVFKLVSLPSKWVEIVIAISVIIAAVNNLKPFIFKSRWIVAFVFGLIHGFGFATVLLELGLSSKQTLLSLLGFNLGVEAGQLIIVLILLPVAYIMRATALYQTWIFKGGSLASIFIASFWTIQRIS